jgi:hypothetical protein
MTKMASFSLNDIINADIIECEPGNGMVLSNAGNKIYRWTLLGYQKENQVFGY